jgi:hypothetical protein
MVAQVLNLQITLWILLRHFNIRIKYSIMESEDIPHSFYIMNQKDKSDTRNVAFNKVENSDSESER